MITDKNILIGKYLSGNASPEEEKEILDWVKEDPENEEEFNRVKEFWTISINLKSVREPDTEKAWQDFKLITESEPKIIKQKPKFNLFKVAAVLALFISSFALIKFFMETTPPINGQAQKISPAFNKPYEIKRTKLITYTTIDSEKVFFLPDSSCVHLNKHSCFIYPEVFGVAERSTSLVGEAFFEIKHKTIPFVISCKQTKILVLGTSFNIKGYNTDKKVIVSVVTGTVQFSNKTNNKSEFLKANERGVFDGEHALLSKANYSDKDFVWWKKMNLRTKIKRFIKNLTHKSNK